MVEGGGGKSYGRTYKERWNPGYWSEVRNFHGASKELDALADQDKVVYRGKNVFLYPLVPNKEE